MASTHANNHAFDLGPPGIVQHALRRGICRVSNLRGAGSTGEAPAGSAIHCTPPAVRSLSFRSISDRSLTSSMPPLDGRESTPCASAARFRCRRRIRVLRTIVSTLGDDRREAARAAVGYRSYLCRCGAVMWRSSVRKCLRDRRSKSFRDRSGMISPQFEKVLVEAHATSAIVAVALHNHHWDPDWSRAPLGARSLPPAHRQGCRPRLRNRRAGSPGRCLPPGQADPRRLGKPDLPYPSRRDL